MRGSLVFVDVDTQRDFLDEDGALYVPDARAIRPRLARLIRHARDHEIPVIATACAHRLDDPEPEPFPPHCLIGTPGHDRVPETREPHSVVMPPDEAGGPEIACRHVTLHKRSYDLFTNPNADRVVAARRVVDPMFVVFGVATDYCVRAAALGLLARGARVAIVVDAVRAVDPAAEPAILTELVRRGATLTVTERVCRDELEPG
jgi:nicotinamidase/pyrazinamidase